MAETTRKESQRRRAESRDRRRSMITEPFERLHEAAGSQEGDSSSGSPALGETLKRATITAAVAAGVGAVAGAAKALLDKRQNEADREAPQADAGHEEAERKPDLQNARPAPAESDESEARAEPQEDEEPEARSQPDDDEGEEDAEARAKPADDDTQEESADGGAGPAKAEREDQDEDRGDREGGDDDLEDAARAKSEPAEIVPKAREELERLLGREAESVSGFARQDGHWSVTLEVVEVRRIPDSTDVLASYELVLDDDGRLARMTRKGRYRRSQLEGQG